MNDNSLDLVKTILYLDKQTLVSALSQIKGEVLEKTIKNTKTGSEIYADAKTGGLSTLFANIGLGTKVKGEKGAQVESSVYDYPLLILEQALKDKIKTIDSIGIDLSKEISDLTKKVTGILKEINIETLKVFKNLTNDTFFHCYAHSLDASEGFQLLCDSISGETLKKNLDYHFQSIKRAEEKFYFYSRKQMAIEKIRPKDWVIITGRMLPSRVIFKSNKDETIRFSIGSSFEMFGCKRNLPLVISDLSSRNVRSYDLFYNDCDFAYSEMKIFGRVLLIREDGLIKIDTISIYL